MTILGINAYHADSSAAIFVKGKLVAAIEEERFTRVKHWAGFPATAIRFCLKEAGIGFAEVDFFAIGRDPRAKLPNKVLYLAKNFAGSNNAIRDRVKNTLAVASIEEELSLISGLPKTVFKNKVRHAEHHRSHLSSAFFASPFEEAACLSVDGSGDFSTTMTATGSNNNLQVLDSLDFPHSLGIFYTALTQFLGFPHYGDEYKVMGMAPYGSPRYVSKLEHLIQPSKDGFFKLDLSFFRKGTQGVISYGDDHSPVVQPLFTEKMVEMFGPERPANEPLTQYHKDLAASVQKITEEVIFHIAESLYKKTGLENLCLAGGVAQNSVANGKILSNTSFNNIYIPSASHDAGIAMGAALYAQHQMMDFKRQPVIVNAYTGSQFSNEEITAFLESKNIAFKKVDDDRLFDIVTDCIINKGVVGWFTGRSEFGPRALGGRSILADPRRLDAKELINSKIKRRESFRPFAPSILKEYTADYFEEADEVPFMEKVLKIRECKRKDIPAVTHIDGSGRLQTVDRTTSPRFYQLIDAFRIKTGVPVLLNTSFNENEPIVNSPADAVACYQRTGMDMLVMENIILSRNSEGAA